MILIIKPKLIDQKIFKPNKDFHRTDKYLPLSSHSFSPPPLTPMHLPPHASSFSILSYMYTPPLHPTPISIFSYTLPHPTTFNSPPLYFDPPTHAYSISPPLFTPPLFPPHQSISFCILLSSKKPQPSPYNTQSLSLAPLSSTHHVSVKSPHLRHWCIRYFL